MRANAKIIQIPLADLHGHPRQAELFGDLPDTEFEALVEDIRKRGQQVPIQVLPDGTIASGHQRVRAAKLLGWTHIDAIVRHDLAALGKDAVVEELIRENVHRRHLDDFAKARCYKAMNTLMLARGARASKEGIGLRDLVAQQLGFDIGGKTLERLALLLDLPPPLQDALASKRITKGLAMRILKEPSATQQKIAADIMAGIQKAALIHKYGLVTPKMAKSARTALSRLVKVSAAELPLVTTELDALASRRLSSREKATITKLISAMKRLLERNLAIRGKSD